MAQFHPLVEILLLRDFEVYCLGDAPHIDFSSGVDGKWVGRFARDRRALSHRGKPRVVPGPAELRLGVALLAFLGPYRRNLLAPNGFEQVLQAGVFEL